MGSRTPLKTVVQLLEEDPQPMKISDEQLMLCKEAIVKMKKRYICAYFCNPKSTMMLSLTRDISSITSLLNPFDYKISPNTTIEMFKYSLDVHEPDIICFFGHAKNETIYFEDTVGKAHPVNVVEFINILKEAYPDKRKLKCVALFSCLTEVIASKISAEFPEAFILFWSTLAVDQAAQSFAFGFFTHIAKFESRTEPDLFLTAYWYAYKTFQNKFKVGDPIKKDSQWREEVFNAKRENRQMDESKRPDHGIPGLIKNSKIISFESITKQRHLYFGNENVEHN